MSNSTTEESSKTTSILNDKLNKISGKAFGVIASFLIAISTMAYTNINNRITTLEDRVSFLYQDKLSRSEFASQMDQIRIQNDATKSDILARQQEMKNDVLARLDLLIRTQGSEK